MKAAHLDKSLIRIVEKDLITLASTADPRIYSNKALILVKKNFVEFRDGSYWHFHEGIYNANQLTYILTIKDTGDDKVSIELKGKFPLNEIFEKGAFDDRILKFPRSRRQ